MIIQQNNGERKGEFLAIDGEKQAGKMTYTWAGEKKLIIDHTEVDPAYKGQGVGKELVYAGVEFARKNQITIIPLCPFAKALFQKDDSIKDVL